MAVMACSRSSAEEVVSKKKGKRNQEKGKNRTNQGEENKEKTRKTRDKGRAAYAEILRMLCRGPRAQVPWLSVIREKVWEGTHAACSRRKSTGTPGRPSPQRPSTRRAYWPSGRRVRNTSPVLLLSSMPLTSSSRRKLTSWYLTYT